MKVPFKIFPSIGYRNSQFQLVSNVDNLRIDIYNQDVVVKRIECNSQYPTTISNLDSPGKLIAKCSFNNEVFQQEIEIKEAFRLGSSEFKKAFLFDDSDYSFFLMKDRLLLYDEKNKLLLTENHVSPTEIHQINKSNYLFITKVGSASQGIVNLGIYNFESFSIVGELLNDYREIRIIPETNKVWLLNKVHNTIQCFELANSTDRYFSVLKKYDGFTDFFVDDSSQNIYINYSDKIIISDLNNLQKTAEVSKKADNAIDKLGNVFTIENNKLTCAKCLTDFNLTVSIPFEINLQPESFIHIGINLKSPIEFTDLNEKVREIQAHITPLIPENKSYHFHSLPASQRISESSLTHLIYPTLNGIFIVEKKVKREFDGLRFYKHQTNWTATPYTIISNQCSLLFLTSYKVDVLIDKTPALTISEYHFPMILVNSANKKLLFSGINEISLEMESSIELLTVQEISYYLIKLKDKYSLYRAGNFKKPVLEQIEILNPELINKHHIIWYSGKGKNVSNANYLNAFDLKTCSRIFIDEKKFQHSLFKDATDFKFYAEYALSSNQIVFNPKSLEIKDAFIGSIESYSKSLAKIVSHRTNIIYLSKFNNDIGKYELLQIPIDDHKYKESYLSPNGQFLVLQDESNKYAWYDIEKNETIRFLSGTFLAFRNDGNLIIEEDGTKAVKIIDALSFQDITPSNYHHYRFMSPDGKLYAQVASKAKYYNKLSGNKITEIDVSKWRLDLDKPSPFIPRNERELAKLKVENNRQQIFETFKQKFEEMGIRDYTTINSNSVVKVEKYMEIGISGTNVTTEIPFPEDLAFYNYSSFSYDNQYFGYVGKPSSNGLIHLFRIDFDEAKSKLNVTDSYLSRYPKFASWVCGFSKTGHFATYDSTPDTYVLFVNDQLFENKTTDIELRQNILNSKVNIYHSYNKWNEIKGKNYLCFSPSGDFLALSEQGYEPLTLGGYGHQESNVVHIAETTTGKILNSFTDHGTYLVNPIIKDTIFVSFSEDEKRLMSMSKDGVVIIRDIKIRLD